MTDLTCEFFHRIGVAEESLPTLPPTKRPHDTEVKQLAAVVWNLDKITPNAVRAPDGLLRGWVEGLCAAASGAAERRGAAATSGARARGVSTGEDAPLIKFIEEVKTVLDIIHKAVLETTQQLHRRSTVRLKREEARSGMSWRWLFFGQEQNSARDQESHLAGMTEVLELFLADLRELLKLCEVKLLKAEVMQEEFLKRWYGLSGLGTSHKDHETEAASNYAAAVRTLSRKLESYAFRERSPGASDTGLVDRPQLVASLSKEVEPREVLRSARADAEDAPVSRLSDDNPPSRYTLVSSAVSPEEVEVIAQANPKIQQLQCLQERDNLEEESVLEITRKVERISELLSLLATEVDHQHAMSSNILMVTNTAIANVSSAQSELEKAMLRKISWRRILFMVYAVGGVLLLSVDLLKRGSF